MRIPPVIQNFVSSSKTAAVVENTIFAVSIETGLKMIGRPAFIMADKEADSPQKKKYAATKEMLYQGICLGIYLSAMKPVKDFIYKGISKYLSRNPENKLKIDAFNNANLLKHNIKEELKTNLKKATDAVISKNFKLDAFQKLLKIKEEMVANKNMQLGKGAKEASAIIGSIAMLTVVAPQISHVIIHPIMKMLGVEKKA